MKSISNIAQQGWEYLTIEHIPWFYTLGFLFTLTGGIALAIFTELYVVAGAVAAAIPLVVLVMRYPRLWLYISVMLWAVWFRTSDEGVSFLDTVMVAFYLGGLGVWFAGKIVKREKIVWFTADYLILLALGLGIGNVVIALLNNVDVLLWMRNYLLFLFLLYYFPIRDYFQQERHLKALLAIIALTVLLIGIANIQMYTKAASNAIYAYELLSARVSLQEPIFLGSALLCIPFFLYARSMAKKGIYLTLFIVYITVLIASFTRGAWLVFFIGTVLIFFMVPTKKRVLLFSSIIIGLSIFAIVVSLFFGAIGNAVFTSIEMRLFSSAKGSRDISLKSRLAESSSAIKGIAAYPIGGQGLGAPVTYYEVISERTSLSPVIHNGYIFLAYKMGIPLAIMLTLSLSLYVYQGLRTVRRVSHVLYRCCILGATPALFAALLFSLTENQLVLRDGINSIVMYIALISIAHKQAERESTRQLEEEIA